VNVWREQDLHLIHFNTTWTWYYHVLEWLSTGFWVREWICWLLTHTTRLGTTSNYSAIANLSSLQITSFPVCCVFTSRSLVTASSSRDFFSFRDHFVACWLPTLNCQPTRLSRVSYVQSHWTTHSNYHCNYSSQNRLLHHLSFTAGDQFNLSICLSIYLYIAIHPFIALQSFVGFWQHFHSLNSLHTL
jgi:hypothetical protein